MDFSTLKEGQKASIQHLDGPLLICAGAGSGKTFTLTQRIVWALLPGSKAPGESFLNSIDEALIITFTNKAAGEIKDRVRSALRDEGMMGEALKVDGAWISTIHGMCNRILHEHAVELGLDPQFELVMDADCDIARTDALNRVLAEAGQMEQNPYSDLFAAYEPSAVSAMVERVLTMASYQTAGLDAIDLGPAGTSVTAYVIDLQDKCSALAITGTEKNQLEAERLAAELHDLEESGTCTVDSLASVLSKVNGNALRGKKAEELRLSVNAVKTELALAANRACAEQLVSLARAVDERYRAILQSQAQMDTSDLIRTTLRAFDQHPEIASLYTDRFKLIMVDEFQDTSQLQIDMIERIAGPGKKHLCTVGDSQQSIYRFQGADVEVYLRHKRNMTGPQVGALEEHLVDNFRSHGDVLAFVRRVCGQAGYFSEPFLDLQAATNGKTYKGTGPRIEVALTTYRDCGSEGAAQAEAAHIAQRFSELRDAGHSAQDMVVLMGSTTHSDIYAQALRNAGFACVVAGGSKFFSSEHVALCQSLLNVLANPYDSENLLVVLTSEVLPVSSDDLLFLSTYFDVQQQRYLRQNPALGLLDYQRAPIEASPLLQHAQQVLQRAWDNLGTKRPYDLFLQVVLESGWMARLQQQGAEGQAKAADILKFARLIREASESNAYDVARVAETLRHRAEASNEKPGALTVSESNAVRIMTVHASKGLEFPIVAVVNCYTSAADRTRPLMMADRGTLYTSLQPQGFRDSLTTYPFDEEMTIEEAGDPYDFMRVIRETNKAREYAEKKRLFYVAATRASDAVIVCMKHKLAKGGGPSDYKDVETDILEGLFPGQSDFPLESGPFEYGGSEPGAFTRVFADESEAVGGSVETANSKPDMLAFPELRPQSKLSTVPVDDRADFFSYTSIAPHSLEDRAQTSQETEATAQPYPEAEPTMLLPQDDDGIPVRHDEWDADKATSFGSAVHRTCEWMALHAEMPSDAKIEDAARRFARQWEVNDIDRVLRAIARWKDSATCQTAFAYPSHQPEVPFVTKVNDHVLEGEIDLLCTGGSPNPTRDSGGTNDLSMAQGAGALGHAFIVDYKTGGSPRETQQDIQTKHLLQAECYAFATLQAGYDSVELHFVRVEQVDANGKVQVANYEFNRGDLPALRAAIA